MNEIKRRGGRGLLKGKDWMDGKQAAAFQKKYFAGDRSTDFQKV